MKGNAVNRRQLAVGDEWSIAVMRVGKGLRTSFQLSHPFTIFETLFDVFHNGTLYSSHRV